MRVHQLVFAATLALFGMHCSSEEPVHTQDDNNITENHPGALAITSPARASFIEANGTSIEVRGTGATKDLTINGAPAEVAPDGTFHATIPATPGLNLIVAVDGESRLEAPFLFGHFVAADKPVPQAIAVDLGPDGISAAAPAASLTSITSTALASRDLTEPLRGQTFKGTILGASWSFAVTGGHHAPVTIGLTPKIGGPGVAASVAEVAIDGTLSILGFSRPVSVTADRATITGDSKLSVDAASGALKVAVPNAEAKLDGFKVDTNNVGFPCCVDDIITGFIRPTVEQTLRDGLRNQLGSALELSLDRLGLPKELDLSKAGLSKIALASRFDGAIFDDQGGTLTAAALFGGKPAEGTPGASAPGWLQIASPLGAPKRPASIGVSFSLDAVNQLLFAAWGGGGVSFSLPQPINAKLTPKLPPVVSISDAGALRLGIGEVIAQREGEPPFAAVTILQDVTAGSDADGLVLTPSGQPTLSITWLTETAATGGAIIAAAAKDQIGTFLKPIRIPVPHIPLDKIGAGFQGQSLAIGSPKVSVDRGAGRLVASGTMTLVK